MMETVKNTYYETDPAIMADRILALESKVEELYQALQIVERTQYGVQQLLGKASEYQGKPRGRLPR
jgi:hypothetical protein